jgi:L-lysine 6-transaminase
MVRFDRILEIIEADRLVENADHVGAYLKERLADLAEKNAAITNPRGRGLMCAFDLPDPETRNRLLKKTFEQGVLMLGCGQHSIRFRPPLTITRDEVDQGLSALKGALDAVL